VTDVTASLGLVVPLFNEADRLGDYGKQLADFVVELPPGSELLFVDDGSADGTVDAVEELIAAHPGRPIRLLARAHEGKGAAVAAGLRAVGGDYTGFCDVDLATPLEHFGNIVGAAMAAPVLAVGSRDLAGSTLVETEGRVRETLGRLYNRVLQVAATPGVVDTQCGAKVASREVWSAILPHCREQGFAWDAELIAVALARRVPVQEVPIAWRHDERSQVRLVRDGWAMVRSIPRIVRSARRAAAELPGARGGDGVFDAENADRLMAADQTHWWFRSKAAFVATALRRTRGDRAGGWFVDVGAGAGGVTSMVGWDLRSTMVVEGNAAMAGQAGRRGLLAVQGEVSALPLGDGAAAVVSLLDVIEHLSDPVPCLMEARRALADDGRVVVSVPAHQWLWSSADEALGHFRRYTRRRLRRDLAAAGLEPVVMTHVFSWLVPPVWATRRLSRGEGAELGLDRTSPVIDRAAMVLTALERSLVGRVSLPWGTSVLCVARPRAAGQRQNSLPTGT
jgi:dolichyl-phosphate beta-glucosyltransferase